MAVAMMFSVVMVPCPTSLRKELEKISLKVRFFIFHPVLIRYFGAEALTDSVFGKGMTVVVSLVQYFAKHIRQKGVVFDLQ